MKSSGLTPASATEEGSHSTRVVPRRSQPGLSFAPHPHGTRDWSCRRKERAMAKLIQVIPVAEESGGLPSALFGLDNEGRLLYGEFEYGGPDPGRFAILALFVRGDYS